MVNKIVKILYGIFCLLFLIVTCEDFYQALEHPEPYHFGAGNLWYYETQELYLLSNVINFFWLAAGFLFCLLQNKFRSLEWGIAIHSIFTLLYLFVCIYRARYYC
jgi:hypothetical protein